MHKQLLQELVTSVRRRIAQGDCPTEPPFSREQLENAVDALAPKEPEWCEHCVFAKHVHYEEGGKMVAPGCTGFAPKK